MKIGQILYRPKYIEPNTPLIIWKYEVLEIWDSDDKDAKLLKVKCLSCKHETPCIFLLLKEKDYYTFISLDVASIFIDKEELGNVTVSESWHFTSRFFTTEKEAKLYREREKRNRIKTQIKELKEDLSKKEAMLKRVRDKIRSIKIGTNYINSFKDEL